jgi:hypothetical protein
LKPPARASSACDRSIGAGLGRRFAVALAALAMLAATACLGDLTPSGGWSAPVTDGEYVYVATKNGQLVRALSGVESKDAQWGFGPPGEVSYGTPLVTEEVVYATAYNCRGKDCDADVFAVSVNSGISGSSGPEFGRSIFNIKSEIVGSPAIDGNTLVFGTSAIGDLEESAPGYLFGIEVEISDQTETESPSASRTIISRELWKIGVGGAVWGSPTIADGIVYFGSMDGVVHAIDLSTFDPEDPSREPPEEIWRFDTGGAVAAQPVVRGDRLFIGDFDGDFYALDLDARRSDPVGSEVVFGREWVFETGSWFWAPAVVDGESVYASNLGGEVFKLDAASGSPLWDQSGRVDGQIVASPVLIDIPQGRAVAVPSGTKDVWVMDALTGRGLQQFPTEAGVKAAPMVVGDLIYVHTLDSELIWYTVGGRSRVGCIRVIEGGACSS